MDADGVRVFMGAKKKEALEQFNRENILSAAKELFEQKGVEKTTMDDIELHIVGKHLQVARKYMEE